MVTVKFSSDDMANDVVVERRKHLIDELRSLPGAVNVEHRALAAGYPQELADQVARGYVCGWLGLLTFNVERHDWLTWRRFEQEQSKEASGGNESE